MRLFTFLKSDSECELLIVELQFAPFLAFASECICTAYLTLYVQ